MGDAVQNEYPPGDDGASRVVTIPQLPTEIHDYLIDQLAALELVPAPYRCCPPMYAKEITRALHACTLVSRSWSPRSSMHALKCVDLSRKSLDYHHLRDFLAAVQQSERLTSNVTKLIVQSRPLDVAVEKIFDAVPNLSALSFTTNLAKQYFITPKKKPKPTDRRFSLDTVELSFLSNGPSLGGLRRFHRIRHRDMRFSDWMYPTGRPNHRSEHLEVHSFTIDTFHVNFLNQIEPLLIRDTLKALCLTDRLMWHEEIGFDGLGSFFRAACTALEHFELYIPVRSGWCERSKFSPQACLAPLSSHTP